MSETTRPTLGELTLMVRQHLESLRAAGVAWLPAAPAGAVAALAERMIDIPSEPTPTDGPAPEPARDFEKDRADMTQPNVQERQKSLELLAQTVCQCARCPGLAATRTQTVFGVGKLDPEICFIGEAPGADEDAQGVPFVGAAGQLLNRIIAACGMKREEVYICNIIKCRPPGNRTPLPDEAAHCREYLEKQLDLIKPKYICTLGSTAASNLLGTTLSIGKLRGRFHDYRGIPVICTYHPAYLLPHRNPDKKKDVWEDMKMLLARLGRPVKDTQRG